MPIEVHAILLSTIGLLTLIALWAFSPAELEEERDAGVIEKTGDHHFSLREENGKSVLFTLAEDAVFFLNEKTIDFCAVQSGRRALVVFKNIKGKLLATAVVLSTLPTDFCRA